MNREAEGGAGARDRILARIREANGSRETVEHPGTLPAGLEPPVAYGGQRPDPVDALEDRLSAAGGRVVRLSGPDSARRWLEEFAQEFASVSICEGVPELLCPSLPNAQPEQAGLGVSMAVGAAAQTGSLLLSSTEGRRSQLLPPTHLVWVRAQDVHATLGAALEARMGDLPAALALHSGPSKSADIGRIIVTGVHGPGRLVAAVLEESGDW